MKKNNLKIRRGWKLKSDCNYEFCAEHYESKIFRAEIYREKGSKVWYSNRTGVVFYRNYNSLPEAMKDAEKYSKI